MKNTKEINDDSEIDEMISENSKEGDKKFEK